MRKFYKVRGYLMKVKGSSKKVYIKPQLKKLPKKCK